MRDRQTDRGRGRSRLQCREPDVGLDPRTPGSCPELKAGALATKPPRDPCNLFLKKIYLF